ncbi:hypothetical protein BRARA_G02208 [Brassica rapa]|uniref:Uncharacterized protein n=1 Tax=Brassica campestris TaxID=3711 RepID=A0A397YNE4_BRACM|nr:hypothetical protein BRARA_G02208 [Brassica rapa]
MAISKALIASLLISLLVLQLVEADVVCIFNHKYSVFFKHTSYIYRFRISIQESSNKKDGYGSKIDCGSACIARCKLSSRPNLCHRACGTCCARCNCVPPSTYGEPRQVRVLR